jgi:nucleotide-binding universal stress UspA family protein
MFKNVLVGVDARPHSQDALVLASRLVDPEGMLTFVHVHSGELHPLHAMTPALVREEREASVKLLQAVRGEASSDGAELVSVVAMSPGGGLHAQAEKQSADLLVVGSCSRGAFSRAALGDDARAALNGAPCAVAIATRGYADHPTPISRIGVAYNGSRESKAALDIARQLGQPTRASVHALEVVSLPRYSVAGLAPLAMAADIDALVAEANSRVKELPGVEGRAKFGLLGEELAPFSGEMDILVVGSRGYGPMRRLVLGSTASYLERHARCSLLVLPRTAGSDEDRDSRDHTSRAARYAATVA